MEKTNCSNMKMCLCVYACMCDQVLTSLGEKKSENATTRRLQLCIQNMLVRTIADAHTSTPSRCAASIAAEVMYGVPARNAMTLLQLMMRGTLNELSVQ